MNEISLNISNECEMSCLNCDLKQSETISAESILEIMRSGQFFSRFKKKKVVNIYGGNPLLNTSFSQLVSFLKNEKIYVRVWTHLNVQLDYIYKINKYVDQWCFYFPYLNADRYQFHVGRHDFDTFEKNLMHLTQDRVSFVLHMPVNQDSLSQLPDVVDFVLKHQCKLWLHFDKRKFSKAIIKDIYYCARYKGIYVIPVTFKTGNLSCNIPLNKSYCFEKQLFYAKWISFFKRWQTKFTIG